MADSNSVVLMIWIHDAPITGNVIKIQQIVEPRNDWKTYKVGDRVKARLSSFGIVEGVIGMIDDSSEKKKMVQIIDSAAFTKLLQDLDIQSCKEVLAPETVIAPETVTPKRAPKRQSKSPSGTPSGQGSSKKEKRQKTFSVQRKQFDLERAAVNLELTDLARLNGSITSSVSEVDMSDTEPPMTVLQSEAPLSAVQTTAIPSMANRHDKENQLPTRSSASKVDMSDTEPPMTVSQSKAPLSAVQTTAIPSMANRHDKENQLPTRSSASKVDMSITEPPMTVLQSKAPLSAVQTTAIPSMANRHDKENQLPTRSSASKVDMSDTEPPMTVLQSEAPLSAVQTTAIPSMANRHDKENQLPTRSNVSQAETTTSAVQNTAIPHMAMQAEQLQSTSVGELTRQSMDLVNNPYLSVSPVPQPEQYSKYQQMQNQLLQLQQHFYSEMSSLRNSVQWLYDNVQMPLVQHPPTSVQSPRMEGEQPVKMERREPAQMERREPAQMERREPAIAVEEGMETFNGFTKDQLRSCLLSHKDYVKAAKMLFRRLFTPDEIMGKSLTGAAPNRLHPAKPAVDQKKLSVIHELIKEKWDFTTRALVNNRLCDLLKPSCTSPMARSKKQAGHDSMSTQDILDDQELHWEARVQQHLKRVYGTLSIAMLAAAAGAYVDIFIYSAGLLGFLGPLGLMLWLAATHHSKENEMKRLGIFVAFTFLSGMSLGPLLNAVYLIDPSIIPTALLGTTVIFGSFSLASLYNRNRSYLYMGGFLMSALCYLCLASLINIFLGSSLLFNVSLYGGLALFCAFILYDTQLIVEKARLGDTDYIWHSVDLFLDFIQIFRRLLIILSRKEESKKRRN